MIEPKSGLEIGVWFHDDRWMMYRGTSSVVIQLHPKTPEHSVEPMIFSRCPACERSKLLFQFQGQKVKRWLLLPP